MDHPSNRRRIFKFNGSINLCQSHTSQNFPGFSGLPIMLFTSVIFNIPLIYLSSSLTIADGQFDYPGFFSQQLKSSIFILNLQS